MKLRRFVSMALLAACLGTGFLAFSRTGPWSSLRAAEAQAEAATTAKPTPAVQPEATSALQDLSRAFRSVHSAIKDAVVNIDTSSRKPIAVHGMSPDDLRRILPPGFDVGPEDAPAPASRGTPPLHPLGTGSGVIISADGYIATNNHVVEDADEITVRLADGRELKAKIIGRDPKTDLAVVKVEADKLTYARFGDSDALDVGDWVLAFGSPFGFDQTMTQGIISAKGRQVNIIGMHNPALAGLTYENFLQTDAAINPGNSGGPLVNLKGEVVGIDTAIASSSGAYNGIGFAIPSNDVKYITDSLIKSGKVVRGYLGVGISDVHELKFRKQAESLGFTGNSGVIVGEVRADTPASGKDGLQPGDIITAINGKTVADIGQLRTTIARTAPGTKITLGVFRKGKTIDVSFALGTQPDSAVVAERTAPKDSVPAIGFNDLGVTAEEKAGKGLTITDVDPNGLAARDLNKGDVILSVQGKEVKTAEDLKAAIAKGNLSKGLHMTVRSADGSEKFVYIEKQ